MLLGRLLADPELHCTPTGERVATFHVTTAAAAPAVAERWRCLAWNQGERQLADLVVEHLRAATLSTWRAAFRCPRTRTWRTRRRTASCDLALAVGQGCDVSVDGPLSRHTACAG
jgi:hypothetical protein